jgi:hypothetical protein
LKAEREKMLYSISSVLLLWVVSSSLWKAGYSFQVPPGRSARVTVRDCPNLLPPCCLRESSPSIAKGEEGTTDGIDDFTPRHDATLMDLVPDVEDTVLSKEFLAKDVISKEEFLAQNSDCMAYDNSIACLPSALLKLPRHSNPRVSEMLEKTESILLGLHKASTQVALDQVNEETGPHVESIFANNYVDLGKIDTVGFDYDYTLVTYTDDLLELIYEKALKRLVADRQYPMEMLNSGLKYDNSFSIRGLAVDKETGWVCHLSYTHQVAVGE